MNSTATITNNNNNNNKYRLKTFSDSSVSNNYELTRHKTGAILLLGLGKCQDKIVLSTRSKQEDVREELAEDFVADLRDETAQHFIDQLISKNCFRKVYERFPFCLLRPLACDDFQRVLMERKDVVMSKVESMPERESSGTNRFIMSNTSNNNNNNNNNRGAYYGGQDLTDDMSMLDQIMNASVSNGNSQQQQQQQQQRSNNNNNGTSSLLFSNELDVGDKLSSLFQPKQLIQEFKLEDLGIEESAPITESAMKPKKKTPAIILNVEKENIKRETKIAKAKIEEIKKATELKLKEREKQLKLKAERERREKKQTKSLVQNLSLDGKNNSVKQKEIEMLTKNIMVGQANSTQQVQQLKVLSGIGIKEDPQKLPNKALPPVLTPPPKSLREKPVPPPTMLTEKPRITTGEPAVLVVKKKKTSCLIEFEKAPLNRKVWGVNSEMGVPMTWTDVKQFGFRVLESLEPLMEEPDESHLIKLHWKSRELLKAFAKEWKENVDDSSTFAQSIESEIMQTNALSLLVNHSKVVNWIMEKIHMLKDQSFADHVYFQWPITRMMRQLFDLIRHRCKNTQSLSHFAEYVDFLRGELTQLDNDLLTKDFKSTDSNSTSLTDNVVLEEVKKEEAIEKEHEYDEKRDVEKLRREIRSVIRGIDDSFDLILEDAVSGKDDAYANAKKFLAELQGVSLGLARIA